MQLGLFPSMCILGACFQASFSELQHKLQDVYLHYEKSSFCQSKEIMIMIMLMLFIIIIISIIILILLIVIIIKIIAI